MRRRTLLFAIILACTAFVVFSKRKSYYEGDGPILRITIDGYEIIERKKPKKEEYLRAPDMNKCYDGSENKPKYCEQHSPKDGYAIVYDVSIGPSFSREYMTCPGGGHDCWYIEKLDENGTMIDIVDRDGNKLLEKMADDVWSGKWDKEWITELTKRDLLAEADTLPWSALEYYAVMFARLREDGVKKPSKIELNVASKVIPAAKNV
jgi:hypothetical protein